MANSGIFINPASKNISLRPEYTLNKEKDRLPLFLGEVTDIDLETKTVTYRAQTRANETISEVNTKAIPLLSNMNHIPIRGEMVLIFYFGGIAYYLAINYKNSQVANQAIFQFTTDFPDQLTEYNDTYKANKTFNVEGRGIERSNVNEGDILVEGRFGHSIKFGSTVKYQNTPQTSYSKSDLSENGDPIMILRNGIKSFDEDVKKDDTSIYLCSSQKIELDTNQNGLEGHTADWSTINVNNEIIEMEAEPVDQADVHQEQSPIPAPEVTPTEDIPPTNTPLATLPVESNATPLATLIGKYESNNTYGRIVGGKVDDSILSMTITQIDQSKYGRAQHPPAGASIGRFQIQAATALDICRMNKINPNSIKFDAAGQDRLYQLLLNYRGYKKYMAGEITAEQFAERLSHEWASLPKDASGVSYYAGVSTNRALVSWNDVLASIRALKQHAQATPNTAPAAVAPQPNRPVQTTNQATSQATAQQAAAAKVPPVSQPGYTSIPDSIDISKLPKLPKQYQRYKGGIPVGNPVDIYVLDGVPVTETVAKVFSAMKKAAWDDDRVVLKLNSGFRANEDIILPDGTPRKGQLTLWEELKHDTSVIARPGHSNHQNGIAMDIQVKGNHKAYKWLVRNALKFQVVRAVPKERWHWEYHEDATTAFYKVPKSHPTWDGLTDGIV